MKTYIQALQIRNWSSPWLG